MRRAIETLPEREQSLLLLRTEGYSYQSWRSPSISKSRAFAPCWPGPSVSVLSAYEEAFI
ncbi:MAG: hypothetical protein IPK72_24080 [Candidatus Eisenbacteria bacterium]|nr:hypothetical protein [Candidatus Eisenbacteria bacterium]